MEKKTFSISIDAPREKVWQVLWTDSTYRQWTAAFHPTSYAVTDWQKGSKVLFLGEGESGMTSVIHDMVPNQYMGIKHLGVVKNGVEDFDSDEVKKWAGGEENYRLTDTDGGTLLEVEMDMNGEMEDMFMGIWPKALNNIKELAERN